MLNVNTPPTLAERMKVAFLTLIYNLGFLPRMVFDVRVDVLTLRGRVRGQDDPVEVLYVGRRRNLTYLTKSIFESVDITARKKANLLSFRKHMQPAEASADVIFLDIGYPYNGLVNMPGDFVEMPDWVNFVVPLHGDWDSVEKRFRQTARKNDLRLIRRNNYRFEPTSDPAVISAFYDDFYLPFIRHRHAEDVVIHKRKSVERCARQGEILQLFDGDRAIVAGLVMPVDGVLCFLWTGMPADLVENQPEAAVSALNYHCLKYAHELGFRAVNLMGTRGFPTDGVYQFKRRWGAVLWDTFSPDGILFKPGPDAARAARFIENRPLFVRRDKTIQQLLCTTAPTCDSAVCDQLLSKYICEGVDQVNIIHLTDQSRDPIRLETDKHPHVQVISTSAAEFHRHFQKRAALAPAKGKDQSDSAAHGSAGMLAQQAT